MPIEQKTVISIVVAGRNFREAHAELITRIVSINPLILTNLELFMQEWQSLYDLALRMFPTAVRDATLLETQYEHYRTHGRANERRAAKALMKRRKHGVAPRPRSNTTINATQTDSSALIPLPSTTAPYNPNAPLTPNPINAAEITRADAASVEADIERLNSDPSLTIDPMPDINTDPDAYFAWVRRRPPPE